MADVNPVVPDTAVPDGTTPHPTGPAPDEAVLPERLIELARAAAVEEAGADGGVGDYLGARSEDSVATSARFAATDRGYRGWYWLVTLAVVEPTHPTISEVVLLPGDGALLAPAWVPWDQRVRAGDVGVGDLLPTPADDDRLVPGYLDSDDPAVREVDYEFGFGRVRVLGREGREQAAERWHDGPFGPGDPMAKQAPAACATCGFYVRLEGLLGQAFGACSNEFSPADGRVVDAAYGCGAHSETVVDAPLISASSAAVMDEVTLEVHRRPVSEPEPEIVGAEAVGSVDPNAGPEGTLSTQAEPNQAEPAQAEPAQAEPTGSDPRQGEPTQDESTLTEPAHDQPAQNEPAQDQPAAATAPEATGQQAGPAAEPHGVVEPVDDVEPVAESAAETEPIAQF